MKFLNAVFVLILIGAASVFAQNTNSKNQKVWRVSEAYTVLVKEKAKVKADLYEARQNFTPESLRFQSALLKFTLLDAEMKKLSRANARNVAKFSATYGDLILAKVQAEVELDELRKRTSPENIAFQKKRIELESLNDDLRQINKSFR